MNNKQPGGLAQMAREVSRAGRSGDTRLAHVNRDEEKLLKAVGGAGTINPATGLPEYKFGLKKLKKVAKKAVSAPTKIASKITSTVATAPLKGFSAVTGIDTDGIQKVVKKPIKLAERAGVAVSRAPLDFSSGAVNLAANPGKQIKQIGREAGRTAQSPLLPIAAGFVPGVGPALAAGISAAQAGYASRKGGWDDIIKNAALAGGTAYLGGKLTQGALGRLSGMSNPFSTAANGAAAGSGFNLGSGSGSLANNFGLNLGGFSQAAAPSFNLGTGTGSLASGLGLNLAGLAPAAASGFNLATGAGSLADSFGLNLSPDAVSAANGAVDITRPFYSAVGNGQFGFDDLKQLADTAQRAGDASKPDQGQGSSGSGFNGLLGAGLGAAGIYGLLNLLNGDKSEYKPAVAPQMSAADQAYYNRPSTQFDWNSIGNSATQAGISPTEYVARNFDKASGQTPSPQFSKPIGMKRGGALSDVLNLVKGRGNGRDDLIDARLSDGEYIMDAETVALLGDGSTDAGARKLDEMRENLRAHKGKMLSRGKISPDAKSPLAYLKGVK